MVDGRISFYYNKLDLLSPKPKFTFRHVNKGIQEFHRRFVLAPADKTANNVWSFEKGTILTTKSKKLAQQKHMSITG